MHRARFAACVLVVAAMLACMGCRATAPVAASGTTDAGATASDAAFVPVSLRVSHAARLAKAFDDLGTAPAADAAARDDDGDADDDAPAEAAPADEDEPAEAAPTEAAPTEAAPTEAAPTEAAPTEAAPAEEAGDDAPAEEAVIEEAVVEDAASERVAIRHAIDPCCCGLPCESGCGGITIGLTAGYPFIADGNGEEGCCYWGANVATICPLKCFCGCGGFGLGYYTHGASFNRLPDGEDGGRFHHLVLSATYYRGIGRSRFFWYAGAGPGFFWTERYLDNDNGFELFAQAGLGWQISRRWRVRAGVNVHGLRTDVARRDPVNDHQDRWVWFLVPAVSVEFEL